jgi:hypothetical protein
MTTDPTQDRLLLGRLDEITDDEADLLPADGGHQVGGPR